MATDLSIPAEVVEDIRAHVRRAVAHAESGFASGQAEEDTLTGAVFDALRTSDERSVMVSKGEPRGPWRWSIDYGKVGSKGTKEAAEAIIGADGVIEIRVFGIEGVQRKSAMFQAKKRGTRDKKLHAQCVKMSVWREAAFVVEYAPTGYLVYTLDDCLEIGGSLTQAGPGIPLADWIIDVFIACLVGDRRLFYEKYSKRLYWVPQPHSGEPEWLESWLSVHFQPKHFVEIKAIAPDWRMQNAREIPRTGVSANRLAFSPRRLFGFEGAFTLKQLKAKRRSLVRAYHPDKHGKLTPPLLRVLTARTNEINAAFEWLKLEVSQAPPRKPPKSAPVSLREKDDSTIVRPRKPREAEAQKVRASYSRKK